QLYVGVVVVATHGIGNNGREQAFDRSQKGDGEDRGQERENLVGVEVRRRDAGKALRDSAKLAADGRNRQMKQRRGSRRKKQGDDGAGELFRETGPEQDDRQRSSCYNNRRPVSGLDVGVEHFHAGDEFAGNRRSFQPQKILDLRGG